MHRIEGKTGQWEVIVGLEVHAQIVSQSKLFSGASTRFSRHPNTQVALVDVAFPGMLPVLNEECIRQGVKTGLGLQGSIQKRSVFDRKNYFYPDLPQGYQISQFFFPLVLGGHLDVSVGKKEVYSRRVNLERIHLEQDAGKSVHDLFPHKSAVDLNRSGIALMEIVTKPDMRSAEEAMAFVRSLRILLRHLGTCDANMEEGSMRADVNVSVRKEGAPLGTRVELKNINSIKFIGQAIEAESQRQVEALEDGQNIAQNTCMFNPKTGDITVMRAKEDEVDYRYFPDPDIPPVEIDDSFINAVKEEMPELPNAMVARFCKDYALERYEAEILSEDKDVSRFFEQAILALKVQKEGAAREMALWIIGEVFARMSEGVSITGIALTPERLAQLVALVLNGIVSRAIGKSILDKIWQSNTNPEEIVKSEGLEQISDEETLRAWVKEIEQQHPKEVAAYRDGKVKLKGFFVGQMMKKSGGKANPQVVNAIIKEVIG
ncbi:MAG: Asp-tRNA(Asn)/Glu-tRNA(Gln) amidotransferase subunit GatB [Alphaproteobacteria bacterium]|nr:Asp-tRNA(Asn)/Glu-tRNA(Gln) amidotransferase subunit GatB [Alphaproteobacteria bacterium]